MYINKTEAEQHQREVWIEQSSGRAWRSVEWKTGKREEKTGAVKGKEFDFGSKAEWSTAEVKRRGFNFQDSRVLAALLLKMKIKEEFWGSYIEEFLGGLNRNKEWICKIILIERVRSIGVSTVRIHKIQASSSVNSFFSQLWLVLSLDGERKFVYQEIN